MTDIVTEVLTFLFAFVMAFTVVIFIILPMGVEQQNPDEIIEGNDHGAPKDAQIGKKLKRAAIASFIIAVIFELYTRYL